MAIFPGGSFSGVVDDIVKRKIQQKMDEAAMKLDREAEERYRRALWIQKRMVEAEILGKRLDPDSLDLPPKDETPKPPTAPVHPSTNLFGGLVPISLVEPASQRARLQAAGAQVVSEVEHSSDGVRLSLRDKDGNELDHLWISGLQIFSQHHQADIVRDLIVPWLNKATVPDGPEASGAAVDGWREALKALAEGTSE